MAFWRTLAVSALALSGVQAAHAGGHDIDVKEVDRRAQKLIKQRGMVGLAIAVIDDGEIVFAKGYGKTSNSRSSQPVSEGTVFRWASLSKSVAAATALSVAEDGHFDLPTPVEEVATHIDLPREGVTLEHVLSHQVGITRNAFDPVVESNRSRAHIKDKLSEAKAICAPGQCHSYQNVAYDLSADMVESALDVPYRAVVNARIFEPLGMDTASVSHEGLTTSADWARPHNSSGRPYNHVKPTYYRVPAAAGVNSSITDLAKWVIANMDGADSPVSEAAREAMQSPRTRTQRRQRQMRRKYPFLTNAQYGLGWRLYDYKGGGRVVAHRGAVMGYRANAMFDPATGDGVVMLWNSNSSRPHGLAYEVMDQAYGLKKTDWLRLNPPPSTVRLAKGPAKTAPKLIKTVPIETLTAEAVPTPAIPGEPAALTAADIERIIAEEDARLMADALAATCPCPEDEALSGNE